MFPLYNNHPTAIRRIRSTLPKSEVLLLQTGASPAKGVGAFPPTTPVPVAWVPVATGYAVELAGMVRGRPNGLLDGVIVVLPIMMFGAFAETGTDVIVDDPLKVTVSVVRTSDNVVVLSGSFDVGIVVGARVFDMEAKATLEKKVVVVTVRSET